MDGNVRVIRPVNYILYTICVMHRYRLIYLHIDYSRGAGWEETFMSGSGLEMGSKYY